MPVGRYFRLGWNQPLVNTLTGPDAPNLRRIFQSLQNWLEYPFIGLKGNTITNLAAATTTAITWGTEVYDDYSLHDANATTWRVPSQREQYLAIGACFCQFANGGTGRRLVGWALNGGGTFNQTSESNATVYITVPYIGIVKQGDLLSVNVLHNATSAQTISNQEAWMIYLPLGG